MAERVWWYGMDNQEDYISERAYAEGGEEEEEESEEDDSFGPDAFDAQFPAWMFKPVPGEWPLLDQEQLKDQALNGTTEEAR